MVKQKFRIKQSERQRTLDLLYRIGVVCLMVGLNLFHPTATSSAPIKVQTSHLPPKKIPLQALQNATYALNIPEGDCGFESVTLNQGKGNTPCETVTFHKVVFGDINRDGQEDAIVILLWTKPPGNASYFTASAMLNQGGLPKYVDSIQLTSIAALSIQVDGVIQVSTKEYSPTDPHCCPSVLKTSRFRITNNQWVQLK